LGTKETILNTALKLFNNNGAYAITTRHIASEMGISPGNLYYYYKNKEEIIRRLLEYLTNDFSTIYKNWPDKIDKKIKFGDLITETGNIIYKYRYFYAEIATLMDKDPQLRKMYFEIKNDRINDFKKIYILLTKSDILAIPISEDDFNIIVENVWSMSEFTIQSMRINRIRITQSNISLYFKRIIHPIKPYLKKQIWDNVL